MRGGYGIEGGESSGVYNQKGADFLSEIPASALRDMEAVSLTAAYPKEAVLFMEKQPSRGVFIVREGEIKLSVSSSEGKTLILRIAKAGEVLGLTAAFSGNAYELTAEALRPCQVAFIRKEDFLRLLAKYPEISGAAVRQLGSQYRRACEQIKTLGLSTSVPEKLAKLLLDWAAGSANPTTPLKTTLPLTHEEIAEFIGTTRESVTRTLSDFKHRQLIILKGSTLVIPNRAALESCVAA